MLHTQPKPEQDAPHPRITASRLGLAKSCPGSFALGPHVSPAPGEAAEKGTAIHAFLEAVLDGVDPDEALPEDPEARAVCEKIDARDVYGVAGPNPSTETPLGWDPATGEAREAPRATAERRDYSALPEGWVAGTADAVSAEGDAVRVTDWKTGAFEVPDPGENPQLLFLGIAAARSRGKDRAILQVVRVNEDGTLRARTAELGPDDLALAEASLVAVLGRVEKSREGVPELRPGRHCRFCPALYRCPAVAAEATALLEDPFEELDPASAARAWERLAACDAAIKRAREALFLYVAGRGGQLPLDDARSLRIVEGRRQSLDPKIALGIVRERFGEDAADKAASVSPTSLKKALPSAGAMEVLDEVKKRGGLTSTTYESLREAPSR